MPLELPPDDCDVRELRGYLEAVIRSVNGMQNLRVHLKAPAVGSVTTAGQTGPVTTAFDSGSYVEASGVIQHHDEGSVLHLT